MFKMNNFYLNLRNISLSFYNFFQRKFTLAFDLIEIIKERGEFTIKRHGEKRIRFLYANIFTTILKIFEKNFL